MRSTYDGGKRQMTNFYGSLLEDVRELAFVAGAPNGYHPVRAVDFFHQPPTRSQIQGVVEIVCTRAWPHKQHHCVLVRETQTAVLYCTAASHYQPLRFPLVVSVRITGSTTGLHKDAGGGDSD
jgi:hypothetical protein